MGNHIVVHIHFGLENTLKCVLTIANGTSKYGMHFGYDLSSSSASTSAFMSLSMAISMVAASKKPKLVHDGAQDLNPASPHMEVAHTDFTIVFPNLESNRVDRVDGSTMTSNRTAAGAMAQAPS
jgi:hypothetical protein